MGSRDVLWLGFEFGLPNLQLTSVIADQRREKCSTNQDKRGEACEMLSHSSKQLGTKAKGLAIPWSLPRSLCFGEGGIQVKMDVSDRES